jgi:hypothetical protein
MQIERRPSYLYVFQVIVKLVARDKKRRESRKRNIQMNYMEINYQF